jgi:hypothetical protein
MRSARGANLAEAAVPMQSVQPILHITVKKTAFIFCRMLHVNMNCENMWLRFMTSLGIFVNISIFLATRIIPIECCGLQSVQPIAHYGK